MTQAGRGVLVATAYAFDNIVLSRRRSAIAPKFLPAWIEAGALGPSRENISVCHWCVDMLWAAQGPRIRTISARASVVRQAAA